MKPKTAASVTVSLLLTASLLCLGGRHALDLQRQNESGESSTTARALSHPDSWQQQKPEPSRAGSLEEEILFKKVRAFNFNSNEADRSRVLVSLVENLQGDDWVKVLEKLEELGSGGATTMQYMILMAWAEAEPRNALDWTFSQDTSTAGHIFHQCWDKDPEGTKDFLRSIARMRSLDKWHVDLRGSILEYVAHDTALSDELRTLMAE